MDFVYDSVRELDIKPKSGEKFPEISIIERNPAKKGLLTKLAEYRKNLIELAKRRHDKAFAQMQESGNKRLLREGSPKIRDTVYQMGNRTMVKLFLSNCGKRLQSIGNVKHSTRFLEAAHAIDPEATAENMQSELAHLLREAYKNMGQYRPERNVLSWERDLFGTNDSKTVSCESLDGKLVASREFNIGDVVFIDKPVAGYVKVSIVQCNCCLVKTLYTVPCANCCAVFYCSVTCLRKDEHYHKYECLGYKISFFPTIDDGILVLRMFVNVMDILKRNALQRQQQQQLPSGSTMTPQQLWEILLEDHKHSEDFLKIFQANTCDHFAEDNATYQIFLQKVTLLMYYIVFDNQMVHNYMACWMNLKEQWPYKFMESVLLRLICITKLNACSFHYDLQYDDADTDEIKVSERLNNTSNSERYIVISNQYYGMYRFQTEMGASSTEFNTISTLLDHGAVVFRAAKMIKKGDALVFKVGSLPSLTTYNFVPPNNASARVNHPSSSSFDESAAIDFSLMNKVDLMLELITELQDKGLLYTEDNFHDVLTFFDCFIVKYKNVPETHTGMVILFNILNKLEALYHKVRLIPVVLMQDNWMPLLLIRGVRFRQIRQDYIERMVNNLHKMYYQG